LNQNRALIFCFDAFSSREPVSIPDQVRGRLSLENAPAIWVLASAMSVTGWFGSNGSNIRKQIKLSMSPIEGACGDTPQFELFSAKTSRPAASRLTRLLPFVATKFVHGCVTIAGDGIMRAQRVWKPVGVDKYNAEIERLQLELASLNKRIAELEQLRSQGSTIEALKASALMLSRQIDDLRSSIATEQLACLLAK
jgi:hypothetical protein